MLIRGRCIISHILASGLASRRADGSRRGIEGRRISMHDNAPGMSWRAAQPGREPAAMTQPCQREARGHALRQPATTLRTSPFPRYQWERLYGGTRDLALILR